MATVLLKQIPYDFASLETEIVIANDGSAGATLGLVEGLEEFDYTATINRVEMYGSGRLPMSQPTEGDAEFEASITVLRYWYNFLISSAQQLQIPLAELTFTLALTYYAKNEELVTDTLTGCRLNEIGNSGSRGADPLMVSMPLRVGNIYFNGVDVFGNTL